MVLLLNIIGFIFMGLMAYFLWAIDGWLWVKAAISFFVGFTFIAYAQGIQKEKPSAKDIPITDIKSCVSWDKYGKYMEQGEKKSNE